MFEKAFARMRSFLKRLLADPNARVISHGCEATLASNRSRSKAVSFPPWDPCLPRAFFMRNSLAQFSCAIRRTHPMRTVRWQKRFQPRSRDRLIDPWMEWIRELAANHDSRCPAVSAVFRNGWLHTRSDFCSASLTRKNHPEDSGNCGQVGELNF